MKKKLEANLTLRGHQFELRFSNIERQRTTRRTEGGHDHREEAPAYVWRGTLEIYSLYKAKGIKQSFSTESFWPKHVLKLDLRDILFLCVSKHLYGIEFASEYAKKCVIDYLALRLLGARSFDNTNQTESPNFHIRLFDFRYEMKDKHLKYFGLISHDRLEPIHGVPGSIIQIETLLMNQ